MDCLSTLESNFIGTEVEYTESVVLEAELFYSVNSIAIQQILSKTQLLKPPINLKHLCIVNRALLSNTFILRRIKVE